MEELLVEFFEDKLYAEEKEEASKDYKKYKTDDGIVYYQTGDPLMDKWELLISEGREDEIDFNEGLSDNERDYEQWKDERIIVRDYTERNLIHSVPTREEMSELDKEMIVHE